jgi:LacI family transcriptional regulator
MCLRGADRAAWKLLTSGSKCLTKTPMGANVCRTPTLRDVARMAGVSMSTVSRSLNRSDLIPEKTRARIRRIADQIGFEFNSHARSLITRKVGTIGLILPPGYESFGVSFYHATLHNALRSVLESNDFDLIVSFLSNRYTGDNNVRRLVGRRKVDGLIIMHPVLEPDMIDFLRSMSVPFVFSHYPPPRGMLPGIDIIYPDNELGGWLAGRHFGGLGRKKVLCIVAGAPPDPEFALRLAGFRRGLGECGIRLAREDILTGDLTMNSAYDAVMSRRQGLARYDGLFALNDLMAMGAMIALRDLGRKVPRDVAVIGYDDTELAESMRPSLTTVHQPREELSLVTCEHLLELIRLSRSAGAPPSAKSIALAPRLAVRGSTGG